MTQPEIPNGVMQLVPAAPPKSDFEKLLERDFVTPRILDNAAEMREYDQRLRKARLYAASDVVPAHYRGKEANCYIALEIAERLGVSELMVMQNTYIVHGRLGFQAQFAIAVINKSGQFDKRLAYEIQTDEPDPMHKSYSMRAYTFIDGERVDGPWVTWAMIEAEGWLGKEGSKWQTIPDLMFRYRAAAFFARTVCPELLMGFQTVEELEDLGATDGLVPPRSPNGHKKRSLADLGGGPVPSPIEGAAVPRNAPSIPDINGGSGPVKGPDGSTLPVQPPQNMGGVASSEAAPETVNKRTPPALPSTPATGPGVPSQPAGGAAAQRSGRPGPVVPLDPPPSEDEPRTAQEIAMELAMNIAESDMVVEIERLAKVEPKKYAAYLKAHKIAHSAVDVLTTEECRKVYCAMKLAALTKK